MYRESPQEWWLRTCRPPVQPRTVGDVVELFTSVGDGAADAGMAVLAALARATKLARKKHPEFAATVQQARFAVWTECNELWEAVQKDEGGERIRAEAMDVVVTALRLWMGEYGRKQ